MPDNNDQIIHTLTSVKESLQRQIKDIGNRFKQQTLIDRFDAQEKRMESELKWLERRTNW